MDRAIKTLIVDDEPVARQVLREELNRMSIVDLNLANGSQKFGNFISLSGLNTSRFLDGSEYATIHDHGNEQNVFARVDFKLSPADTVNLNFQFTRSWFQTPNSYDAQNATDWWSITEASVPMARSEQCDASASAGSRPLVVSAGGTAARPLREPIHRFGFSVL